VSENLLIKQRDVDYTLARLEHLLGKASTLRSFEGEREQLIPFRLLTFIYSSTFNHVSFRIVNHFNFNVRLNFRSPLHFLSQLHEGTLVALISSSILASLHASVASIITTILLFLEGVHEIVSKRDILSSNDMEVNLYTVPIEESDWFSLLHGRLKLALLSEHTGQ
jgi:hypothetical protein